MHWPSSSSMLWRSTVSLRFRANRPEPVEHGKNPFKERGKIRRFRRYCRQEKAPEEGPAQGRGRTLSEAVAPREDVKDYVRYALNMPS